jgi:hypothetical protein
MAQPIPVVPYDDAAFILGNLGVSGGIAQPLTLADVGAALPINGGGGGSVSVRQSIQDAPVDANGRADFVTSSGLVVSGTGISGAAPLILAVTDNPNSLGQPVDRIIKITTNPSWPTLATNTTSYLFIEDDGAGTLSYTVSTLTPSYGQIRPSSPSTGQFHYDIWHRGRAVVWDGTSWVERLIICVGEAVTGASTVTTLLSYAILGRWQTTQAMTVNVEYNLTTKLGYPAHYQDVRGAYYNIGETNNATLAPNGSGGYPMFSRVIPGSFLGPDLVIRDNVIRIRTHGVRIWSGNLNSTTPYAFTSADAVIYINRTF